MQLAPWQQADLPAAPTFSPRNFIRVVGPGTILLATSIGSGEWLIGPATAVEYGTGLLGVVTVSVLLQVLFNIETMRYTIATGEPIFTGFMRVGGRPAFWGVLYIVFGFLHLGWPAFAATSASTLFAAFNGRLPLEADAGTVRLLGYATFILCVVLLLCGRTVEHTLERLSWTMMAVVFSFLAFANLLFVPFSNWTQTLKGFAFIGPIPPNLDWTLIGAFAAYAGAGGVVNLLLSNWARDKGFGMGRTVGAIGGFVGGENPGLSPAGKIFPMTEANLARWKVWMQYLHAEQFFIWGFFCIVGMFLTVNLTVAITPPGTSLTGLGAGAYQAQYLSRQAGQWMWPLALMNGFWILFSTQIAVVDGLVRLATDVLWAAVPGLRRICRDDVRRVYFGLLLTFGFWGCITINIAQPVTLVLIGANAAGFILTFSAIHIVIVNRKLLPAPLRPPLWREAAMVAASIFFGFFVFQVLVRPFLPFQP